MPSDSLSGPRTLHFTTATEGWVEVHTVFSKVCDNNMHIIRVFPRLGTVKSQHWLKNCFSYLYLTNFCTTPMKMCTSSFLVCTHFITQVHNSLWNLVKALNFNSHHLLCYHLYSQLLVHTLSYNLYHAVCTLLVYQGLRSHIHLCHL